MSSDRPGHRPFLVVLSSPSGAGKTSICREVVRLDQRVAYSVSATTRPRRPGEVHGRSYWFYTGPQFRDRVRRGGLIEHALVYICAVIVLVYGVLGGLRAAYWTDFVQGIFIILLSVLLIPMGLKALVEKDAQENGRDPAAVTWADSTDGFRIMHERVPEDYFSLFSGPSAGEFPVPYIISLTLLVLVGIVVQPHFIATGGGSAKTEFGARVGLVAGNFLKRLCTVGWALTALIALALHSGHGFLPDQRLDGF